MDSEQILLVRGKKGGERGRLYFYLKKPGANEKIYLK